MAAIEPRNPELEQRILNAPHRPEPYLTYGAWLDAQGASRGRLIALQAGLLAQPQFSTREQDWLTGSMQRAAARLIESTGMLGPLSRSGALQAQWFLGFVSDVDVELHNQRDAVMFAETLTLPSLRFVRALKIQLAPSALKTTLAAVLEAAPLTLGKVEFYSSSGRRLLRCEAYLEERLPSLERESRKFNCLRAPPTLA